MLVCLNSKGNWEVIDLEGNVLAGPFKLQASAQSAKRELEAGENLSQRA